MSVLKEDKEVSIDDVSPDVQDSKITLSCSIGTFHSSERVDNSCYGKFHRVLRKIYKVTSSLLGIIIILIAYSFLGAWIFMMIELKHEKSFKLNITLARDAIIDKLLNASEVEPTSKQLELNLKEMLVGYESDIMHAYKAGILSSSEKETWEFWSSLFFCGTVFTTIGYGNIAPATDEGRAVCMIYAALGIPLALLVLAELGKRFTVALKFLWAFVRRYYYTGYCGHRRPFKKSYGASDITENHDKHNGSKSTDNESKGSTRLVYGYEVNEQFNLPITVALVIMVIYILIGAGMYSFWEDWNYLEAFYFVFISISTIGFGDVIPAHPKFFILSSVYIFVGLSLVSMCINVAIEFFTATADMAKEKMGKATKKLGKKVTAAKGKVQQVGHGIKTNIKDEKEKLRHITDKWSKTRSRSNTPVSTESDSVVDQNQVQEESSSGKDKSEDPMKRSKSAQI